MARNAYSTTLPVQWQQYRRWIDGTVEVTSTSNGTHFTYQQSQGDIVESDGIVSTNYGAHRLYVGPSSFDCWGSTLYNGLKGGVWSKYALGQKGTIYYPTAWPGLLDIDCSSAPWQRLVRIARSRALEGLVESDVDFGQFLGELPESLKMIAKTSVTVLQAYRAARSGNFTAIPKILGVNTLKGLRSAPASVWFAYKFGWLPLVTDVYNAHSAVMKQLNRPNFAQVKRSVIDKDTLLWNIGTYRRTNTQKLLKGAEVGVTYSVENATLAGLNSLGLVNPVSVAWELLPMSFVVDWFVPIGSFIRQLTAPLGLAFRTGYETAFAHINMDLERIPTTYPNGTQPEFHVEGFRMKRTKLTTWPKPSLVVDLGINPQQALTLLGLLSQRI